MQSILVKKVESKHEKKLFINVPWSIYNKKDHPQWVPPLKIAVQESLDTKKNPFYKRAEIELFVAFREGEKKPVGRIAAIHNRGYNEFHKEEAGFWGFFECIDDQNTANALFKAAQDWLEQRHLKTMMGPVNPSTNHECGLLVRGQSQHPTIQTTWNPKYYETLVEHAGHAKCKDLVAYWLPTSKSVAIPQKLIDHANQIQKEEKITFRDFDLKNFDREIDICFDIYNDAWEKNWGFFPMTKEEFVYTAKDMKLFLDRRFAFIAEYEGKPAGLMITLPDFNHILKRIPNGQLFPTGIFKILAGRYLLKSVRVMILGVKKEYRNKGLFSLFTYESFKRAQKYGVVGGEASWILEDNEAMNKPWQDIGAPLYRRWRIYSKNLPSN